jgi:hypothetical protein
MIQDSYTIRAPVVKELSMAFNNPDPDLEEPNENNCTKISDDLFSGETPVEYLQFYNNNQKSARHAYLKTLKWREINKVDEILTTPQPYFHEILRLYPHAIHGVSKEGAVVLYEVK